MKDSYEVRKNLKGTEYVVDLADGAEQIVAKCCLECGEMKDLSLFFKHKTGVACRRPKCKECEKEYNNTRNKKYYEINKEQCKEYSRNYAKNHREYYRKYSKEYYRNNKEYHKACMKEHKRTNKKLYSMYVQRREARKRALPDTLTNNQLKQMKELQNNKCYLSGALENLHLEHFIPLSWNAGGTTFENCYYMEGSLNISKGNRNPFEWIKTQPEEVQENFHNVLVPELAKRNSMSINQFKNYVYDLEIKSA